MLTARSRVNKRRKTISTIKIVKLFPLFIILLPLLVVAQHPNSNVNLWSRKFEALIGHQKRDDQSAMTSRIITPCVEKTMESTPALRMYKCATSTVAVVRAEFGGRFRGGKLRGTMLKFRASRLSAPESNCSTYEESECDQMRTTLSIFSILAPRLCHNVGQQK